MPKDSTTTMSSQNSRDSFSIADSRASLGDESSPIASIVSAASLDPILPTCPPPGGTHHHHHHHHPDQTTNYTEESFADRQAARQVTVNVRRTGEADREELLPPLRQQDQRQHAGGQPLPPGGSSSEPALMSSSLPSSSSLSARPPPLNLSDYARSMLQHTKQQMDATPGSPPPPHLHVAGPAGNRSRSQSLNHGRSQHHHYHHQSRHGHRSSLTNEAMSSMPNGI